VTPVTVVGNADGGKSRLSLTLGQRLGLPCHALDDLLWQPAWRPTPEAVFAWRYDALLAGEY